MNKEKYDILVVGAGFSGAVIAERYAKVLNKKVLVIEKRNHIGGNCYDFINEIGIRESKYGAHLFHTNSEKVWDYVNLFGDWTRWEHKVIAKVDDKLVPIPVNITTVNKLFDLNIKNENEMKEWLANNQVKYNEIKNSEEMGKSRVGEVLYEKMFKEYTKKQWNVYPDELDKTVLERIPVRTNYDDRYFTDKHQYLPTYGYTSIFEKMLSHPNITLLLETDYNSVKNDLNVNEIFFTGPIDHYFSNSGLPKLEYRSIKFRKENLDIDNYFQENSVVNYPSKDVEFTRIVEYKHFLRQKAKGTTIVYETTCDSSENNEQYYPIPNQYNLELYNKYKELADNEKGNNRIHFVGRLANYKYFNMDQAILNSLELFEKVAKKSFEIVVARYCENIDWLDNYRFIATVYNKGNDEVPDSIKLPNVGREAHTYLYHIIHNYDNLADVTFFTQGRMDDHSQLKISDYAKCDGYKFGSHSSILMMEGGNLSHFGKWKQELDEGKMRAPLLDFFSWWMKYVKNNMKNFSYNPGAIFSVTRENIRKHPKEYYMELIKFVDDHVNPSEGHYFERAWRSIFE